MLVPFTLNLSQDCRMAGTVTGTARPLSGEVEVRIPWAMGLSPPGLTVRIKNEAWLPATLYTQSAPGSQSQPLTLRSRMDIGGPMSQVALSSRT